MSEQRAFPYTTNLNTLFPALRLIDIPSVVSQVEAEWFNQTLCQVNDSVIRLGVMQGEYHWHKHDGDKAAIDKLLGGNWHRLLRDVLG